MNLRVQCFNLDSMLLTVHDGKGQKDRTVPLPARALPEIREQMDLVRRLHAQDLAAGYAGVFLPRQLEKKYKNAAREFIWQWFLPAPTLTFIPNAREQRRYHLHETNVQGAVKEAAARATIPKRVSPHTFRHTFASHLLLANYDLQTIQRLLGHSDIKTTMIYLQTRSQRDAEGGQKPAGLPLALTRSEGRGGGAPKYPLCGNVSGGRSCISQADYRSWRDTWESHGRVTGQSWEAPGGQLWATPASAGPRNISQAYGWPAAGGFPALEVPAGG